MFLALFSAYHKAHKSINFAYTANGGNAGVKDVQSGKIRPKPPEKKPEQPTE